MEEEEGWLADVGRVRPRLSDTDKPLRRDDIAAVRPWHLFLCVVRAVAEREQTAPQSLQAWTLHFGKSDSRKG